MRLRSRKFAFALACIAALIGESVRTRAADPALLEKQVKSAFVLNFIQFVDWPQTAFDKPDDPIIIGVVDQNALGDALSAAIDKKVIRGRKLVIQQFTPQTVGRCHLLILGNTSGGDLQSALKSGTQASVLSIGDSENFTASGGIIRFYVEDRKMHFEINQAAAQRAQLQISSKLLKLAKVVNN